MYYLFLVVAGKWLEYGRYERYAEAWDVVYGLSYDTPFRLHGPEGTWERNSHDEVQFTPTPKEVV